MKAALLTIGDEILIGQITDTNSVWLAQQLTALGIVVTEMVSISDKTEHICDTLDRLAPVSDLIIMTGGLGPTKDDLTKQTLNEYFGGNLVMDQPSLDRIEEYFKKRGRPMLESNTLQAYVPDNCRVLANNFGTAPGMWFTKGACSVVAMPGVPFEMKPMVSEQLIPVLRELNLVPSLVNRTIMTEGIPESYLAALIRKWEENLPACMKLAYLPRPGIVRLRLTVTGECAGKAEELLDKQTVFLKNKIGEHIFSYEDETFEEVIGKILLDQKLTISTAESCTGGNISRLLTSVPGSSRYFKGSIIAYSNEIKEKLLRIDPATIVQYGAVSREVVEAMALGVIVETGSDVSIATSGIAGPDGGTDSKPVGTVWIAVADKKGIFSKEFRFGGNRELVIEQSSMMAMGLLRKLLLGFSLK